MPLSKINLKYLPNFKPRKFILDTKLKFGSAGSPVQFENIIKKSFIHVLYFQKAKVLLNMF